MRFEILRCTEDILLYKNVNLLLAGNATRLRKGDIVLYFGQIDPPTTLDSLYFCRGIMHRDLCRLRYTAFEEFETTND